MEQNDLKSTKHTIRILWIISGIIDILAAIISVFLKCADTFMPDLFTYVYDGKAIKEVWRDGFLIFNLVCLIAVLIMIIISFVLTARIKKKDKNSKAVSKVIVSVLLIIFSSCIFVFDYAAIIGDDILYQPEYYEFSDGKHTIVICEETFFVGGYGTVYQVNYDNSAYMIKEFITDDGYRNNGNYELDWSDGYVDIYYLNGSEDNKVIDSQGNPTYKYKITANFKK